MKLIQMPCLYRNNLLCSYIYQTYHNESFMALDRENIELLGVDSVMGYKLKPVYKTFIRADKSNLLILQTLFDVLSFIDIYAIKDSAVIFSDEIESKYHFEFKESTSSFNIENYE